MRDMDASKSFIGLVFVMIMVSSISTSESYVFSVGDRSGWVENPPVPYTNWAGSKRFSINDSLVFNYKGQDSVLLVTKESYDSCNLSSPIQTLSGGNPSYKLDHSGPHYFISGAAGNCSNGQKMMMVVLAVRNPAPPAPSTPSPSPSSSTPPPSPSPSPSPPAPLTPSSSPTPSTAIPSTPSPSSAPSTPAPSTPFTATPESPPPPKTPSSSSVFRVSGVSMGLVALVLGAVLN